MILKHVFIAVLVLFFYGCQTTAKVQDSNSEKENMEEVLSTVAGALSGKQLSEKELKDLEKQIQTDEEAQSAVQAITDSVGGKTPQVKYCPVTGRRYAAHLETCPEHQVTLEVVSP